MAWTDGLGWAFRQSLAHATDGARDQFVGEEGSQSGYPQTSHSSGETVTWGTVGTPNEPNGRYFRNRDGAPSPKLAGVMLLENAGATDTHQFKVTLPNAGTYRVAIAAGAMDGFTMRNYWRILDDTTELDVVDNSGTAQTPGYFADAEGTIHTSAANWLANNVPVDYVFATTTFIIEVGVPGAGTSDYTGIAYLHIQEVAGDPAPSITDVDEDDTVTQTQANVEIDGTGFDTATVEIRQGGFTYTPSIDSQSATSIQFDMPALGATGPVSAPHAGSATLAVVNGDAQEDTLAITITDDSGTETYLIGTPNADPDLRLTASADAVSGDYVRISNVQGGTIADVTVNSDLTWDAEEAVTAFDVQYWDAGDGTWGDVATQTTQDTVPDAFSFTDQTDVELSTVCTSATITVAGLGTGLTADITVTGGEYSINGGAFTSSAGTVTNGDEVRARVTSSGSYATGVSATVDIGGVTDGFTATTRAQVAPTITTVSMAGGYVGVAYSRIVVASGDGPFTWAVTVGALPDGLSLNAANGAITGTPTTAETANFTVEATNDAGNDTQALSITIAAEAPATGSRVLRMRRPRGMRFT